jgi:hypothetical protein
MPYFLYRISQKKNLQCLDKFGKYKEARDRARELRTAQAQDDRDSIRVIFANNENEAEILLLTPREAPVEGDD